MPNHYIHQMTRSGHLSGNHYAWAVRDVTVVAEPISSTFFIVDGTLLAGGRFFKRKPA
jgi:hypothetical protein